VNENHLDVVRMVLDHQLLDANYIECGKVEDVELSGGGGSSYRHRKWKDLYQR